METKICKECKQEKLMNCFFNRRDEKDGKHRYCKACLKIRNDKWYQESKHHRADYYKQYREENKQYFNQYSHHHYHTKKELYREWNRNKYNSDIEFRLKHITAARISSALSTYQTLKQNRTIEYLGCTIEEYTQYLEQKFTPDMTWDNHGEYWEIDHIKPIDAFNLSQEDQLYECFHYTNTQPLPKVDNREKSNKH